MTKTKTAILKGFNFAWEPYKAQISAEKQGLIPEVTWASLLHGGRQVGTGYRHSVNLVQPRETGYQKLTIDKVDLLNTGN